MQVIRTITEEDFGREPHPDDWSSYSERIGARAILLDKSNRIALMHVTNRNYYKLPGGGLDEGEHIEDTLRRELKEEAGAESITIVAEVGQINEYREGMKKKSMHKCFLVRLEGELGTSEQTDKELDHGYQIVWAKDINEAIELVESGKPQEYGQDFERLRELTFLNFVKSSKLI